MPSEVEKGAIAALRKHKPGRRLDTNVEYYTALLLEALEMPRERLHRAVRRRPHRRLVRARLRAGEGRPHHPPAIELCRRAPVLRRSGASAIAEPRQVRARVPSASNTQTIRSAPAGVKRALKWRRQKLPSAKANSASVPSASGRDGQARRARRGLGLGGDQLGDAVDQRTEAQGLALGRWSASGRRRCAARPTAPPSSARMVK